MSLNKRTASSGKTFLKIFGGKIVQESSKKFTTDEELKERENKSGNVVYYVEYDSLSGLIVGATIRNVEALNADFLELDIVDVVEQYRLSIPIDSRFAQSFMYRMLNLDLSKPVEIVPYTFESKEGKKVSGLNLFQDGEKVAPLYTREVPNGLPEAKQVRKGREVKWDFTDQTNFLYDEFEKFKEMLPERAPEVATSSKSNTFEVADDDDAFDDLPF